MEQDDFRMSFDKKAYQKEYMRKRRAAKGLKQTTTVDRLRELISGVPKESEETPVMPVVYKNDFGGVITREQWEKLQERKRRAKEGGYVIDEYSQA